MTAFTAGFGLAFSLIAAIGAQNAFVLRHGLRRQYVLSLCLLCATTDAFLIAIGVAGFDTLSTRAPWLIPAAKYGGAVFLGIYGGRAFWRALAAADTLHTGKAANASYWATISACLAITFLNPHVYLDTVILLGSISTQYPGAQFAFAAGASLASLTFFFTLGFGARLATPLFQSARAWRVLDAIIGAVMWSIALSLVWV